MPGPLVRIIVLLPLVLSGCMVRSLSPIYTDEDLVPMPEVEGTWKGEDDGETMSFLREGDGYVFTYVEEESAVVAAAHFARIDKRIYMDLTVAESGMDRLDEKVKEQLAAYRGFTTPVHVFYEVEVREKVLRMRSMNHVWAKERREKGRLWIDHIAEGDSTLLTADTPRVQRFIRRWAGDDDAWSSWNELPLVPAEAPVPVK